MTEFGTKVSVIILRVNVSFTVSAPIKASQSLDN